MKNIKKLILFAALGIQTFSLSAQCTNGDCNNGKGRFLFANGDRYIGEFKKGLPDGRGAYYYTNGDVYKGQFKEGERHGYGTMKWKAGEMYIGEYVRNQREGEGTYYFADGNVKHGVFKMGELVEDLTDKKDSTKVEPVVVQNTTTTNTTKDPFNRTTSNPVTTTTNPATTNTTVANTTTTANKSQQLAATSGVVPNEKRLALIIGNANYTTVPLKNAVNDAEAMAAQLRKVGFDVWLYKDATQREMKQAIRDFGQQLQEKKAVGLFFYAGHGLQADGRNYIVPVDADIRKAQDIEFEALDLSRVFVEMEYAENPLNIAILDACRDNPYKNQFGDGAKRHTGFTQIQNAPVNSMIAFSTAPGAVASDGDGKNGLYTQELLKCLGEKNLKLEDIFKKVRSNVRKASGGKQIPWENSSIESDFFFSKK